MTENNASMSSFAETDLRRNPRCAQMPVITAAREALELRTVNAGRAAIAGGAAVSAALLMTELALTRGFSVTMYYHLAFLAISSEDLGFSVLYAPSLPAPSSAEDPVEMRRTGTSAADYRRLILASNRQQFLSSYLAQLVDAGVAWTLPARIAFAVMLIAPVGVLLGTPMPGGMRPIAADRADIIPWAWGINGAFSVVGATLAVFTAMNWGFSVTLLSAAVVYALAALTLWRA